MPALGERRRAGGQRGAASTISGGATRGSRPKTCAEGLGDQRGHVIDGDVAADLARDRRHLHGGNAARDDEVEERELGGHVEREAVPGDPVARMHADRGDLPSLGPHARVAASRVPAIPTCASATMSASSTWRRYQCRSCGAASGR